MDRIKSEAYKRYIEIRELRRLLIETVEPIQMRTLRPVSLFLYQEMEKLWPQMEDWERSQAKAMEKIF